MGRLKWWLMVDEVTQKKFSICYTIKNGMSELASEFFHRRKIVRNEVPKFRSDNSGENRKPVKRLSSKVWNQNVEL